MNPNHLHIANQIAENLLYKVAKKIVYASDKKSRLVQYAFMKEDLAGPVDLANLSNVDDEAFIKRAKVKVSQMLMEIIENK